MDDFKYVVKLTVTKLLVSTYTEFYITYLKSSMIHFWSGIKEGKIKRHLLKYYVHIINILLSITEKYFFMTATPAF